MGDDRKKSSYGDRDRTERPRQEDRNQGNYRDMDSGRRDEGHRRNRDRDDDRRQKDRVSGDSLQYAFVEFADRAACEQAYFKMDNVLIDDRRIHVDFSQSVSKYRWKGKGRLEILDDKKQEKKNVDLKEMIDKERAEIKSKGDGKIERNEKNLQGRSREQEGNRDDGYKRGVGREDRRKDDRRKD